MAATSAAASVLVSTAASNRMPGADRQPIIDPIAGKPAHAIAVFSTPTLPRGEIDFAAHGAAHRLSSQGE